MAPTRPTDEQISNELAHTHRVIASLKATFDAAAGQVAKQDDLAAALHVQQAKANALRWVLTGSAETL